MRILLIINFIVLFTFSIFGASAQVRRQQKMEDLFIMYIEKELSLTAQESVIIKPLIHNYLIEVKNINRKFEDPLLKEQQRVDLKMHLRSQIRPIIGENRSISFFVAEQNFRRRIRDELNRRRGDKNL